MARVRVTCPACGDVELGIRNIVVIVCTDNDQVATYSFCCPKCKKYQDKSAYPHVVDILVAAGAQEQRWSLPKLEPQPAHPVLDHDYLLDFHEDLEILDPWDELEN